MPDARDPLHDFADATARVVLRDGTVGWVWPLLPTDREALVAEFEELSEESRRRRFLRPVVALSESMLNHLVDDVDGVDHVALVLMAEVGTELVPCGIGRILRYEDQPRAADVAVTVRDDWQGRGVATALLEVLIPRRPVGVDLIVTDVAADNPASLAMLRRLGPMVTRDATDGVVEVEVALTAPALPVPEAIAEIHALRNDPRQILFRTRDLICPWLRPPSP